jgi:hypothetical protein
MMGVVTVPSVHEVQVNGIQALDEDNPGSPYEYSIEPLHALLVGLLTLTPVMPLSKHP